MTGQDAEGGYAFAQQPRAVSSGRGASAGGKYRDPNMADDRLAVSTLPTSLLLHARASAMPLAIQHFGEAGNHRGTCLVLLLAARFFPPCMSRSSKGGGKQCQPHGEWEDALLDGPQTDPGCKVYAKAGHMLGMWPARASPRFAPIVMSVFARSCRLHHNHAYRQFTSCAGGPPTTYACPSLTSRPPIRVQVNIMWDRRVVRGNTYAAQVLPAVITMFPPPPLPSLTSNHPVRPSSSPLCTTQIEIHGVAQPSIPAHIRTQAVLSCDVPRP